MSAAKERPLMKAGLTAAAGSALASAVVLASPVSALYPGAMVESMASAVLEWVAYGAVFFLVFWVVLMRIFPRRRLSRARWPKAGQIVRETLYSVSTQFVFLAVAVWTLSEPAGVTENMYTDIQQYGWAYLGLTVFLAFLAHDTAFYWSHRIMHHPWLFNRMHRVHHQSVDPTPFATSAFHPAEAVVESIAGMAPLIIYLVMPLHPLVPAIWGVGQILFNVIGHLGFEIYPRNWLRIPVLCWKTTAMHHYMHHQRVGGNYGLYFRFWDRICGTEFPDFEARYARFFDEPERRR